MTDNQKAISAFITGAPPGELKDVINDVKALTISEPEALHVALPVFRKYNEEQFTTVDLPGSSQRVLVTPYNSLMRDRYYDMESSTSYQFDHETHSASMPQSHATSSQHTDLILSLNKALWPHAAEHYNSSTHSVFPTSDDASIIIVLVANKYSPSNYWNGRWRCIYEFNPSSNSLNGTIKVDVHYYEDGNVRLTAKKDVKLHVQGLSPEELIRELALTEKKYQEELNRGFSTLSEGAFKALRRQLPVTRQRVDWEKIGSYRASREVPGAKR